MIAILFALMACAEAFVQLQNPFLNLCNHGNGLLPHCYDGNEDGSKTGLAQMSEWYWRKKAK